MNEQQTDTIAAALKEIASSVWFAGLMIFIALLYNGCPS